MCRCYACDKPLSNKESVRRFKDSLDFVDLCNECLGTISDSVPYVEGHADDEEDEENDAEQRYARR